MRSGVQSLMIVVMCCCSIFGQSEGDRSEAQRHYKIALEALKDSNLPIASEELIKAAELAPSNALIRYYLGLVQSKQDAPALALENLKRAQSLGLPKTEDGQVDDLLAKLEYEIRKTEADATHVTPQKLVGLYRGDVISKWDDTGGDWQQTSSSQYHFLRDRWKDTERTLSLSIVNESHITGFIRRTRTHTQEFKCTSDEGRHLDHKNWSNSDTQVVYIFVDLSVSAAGVIEGTQRQVCYGAERYGSMQCVDPTAEQTYPVAVTRNAEGTLTFNFEDGGSREYKRTGSVPASVENWVSSAPELIPFRR